MSVDLLIGVAVGVLLAISYCVGLYAGRRAEQVKFDARIRSIVAELPAAATRATEHEPEHRHAA